VNSVFNLQKRKKKGKNGEVFQYFKDKPSLKMIFVTFFCRLTFTPYSFTAMILQCFVTIEVEQVTSVSLYISQGFVHMYKL